jgi:hypothetical protein
MLRFEMTRMPEGATGDLSDGGEAAVAQVPASPEGAAPDGEGEVSTPASPTPAAASGAAPDSIPYNVFKRRVDQLTKQKADLEEQLKKAGEQFNQDTGKPAQPASSIDYRDESIKALVAAERLNEKANDIALKGQELFPDFMMRVQMMNQTLGVIQPQSIEAVIEAAGGNDELAAKIFHELSGDIQRAATIMAMSPIKQGIALAKVAEKLSGGSKPATRSATAQAPAPITPRQGGGSPSAGGTPDLANPKTSLDDWMAERNRTAKRRR